jgi:hypothetical protein
LGATALAGLAAGFGEGFGAGFGFGGIGTVTVLVMVCVVDEPGAVVEDPTQTVTDPEPSFEPWVRPELEDAELQAIAKEESKETKAAAISTLAKAKLDC